MTFGRLGGKGGAASLENWAKASLSLGEGAPKVGETAYLAFLILGGWPEFKYSGETLQRLALAIY